MAIVPAAPDTHQQLSYLPPDFINLSLPNARFSDDLWIRLNGTQRLTIAAVHGVGPNGSDKFVPYGKYARAALLLLCTEAVRTGDPVIPISQSYRGFMKQLGVSWNQANANEAVRQMQALAACSITVSNTVTLDNGDLQVSNKRYFVSTQDRIAFAADRSGEISEENPSVIELSQDFMQMLSTGGRVPVRTDAWLYLLQQSRAAMALDIYLWLAYRLHHLKAPARISWEQLRQQFGSESELRNFKIQFRRALAEALEVYPEANVSEFGSTATGSTHGIMLKLSKKTALDSAWTAP